MALVALAVLAFATCMGAYLGNWVVPAIVIALYGPALWMIREGYVWVRWLIATASMALGLWGLVLGVGDLVISFADAEAMLNFAAAAFLVVIGATLYASEAIRELGELRRNPGHLADWEAVSVAAEKASSAPIDSVDLKDVFSRGRWGHLAATTVLVASAIAWVVFLAFTMWMWHTGADALTQTVHGMQGSRSGLMSLIWLLTFLMLAGLVPTYLLLGYVALFIAPFLLSMPVALPLAIHWRRPAHFLILRPFNRRTLSLNLRRIVCNEVAPLGHCYTLADADISIPPMSRLPILYGQLTFFTFRQRKIISPFHLTALSTAMKQRLRRNINWAVSRTKLFPVASVDAAWQACVRRLVGECHGVVMDLSGISDNIRWELDLLKSTCAVERTVFLVATEQAPAAKAALDQIFGNSPPLITYGQGGLDKPGVLIARLADILGRFAPVIGPRSKSAEDSVT